MRVILIIAAALHLCFMTTELFPWSCPVALRLAGRKLPVRESFTIVQQKFVAGVVHNAGIYNGILAGGLLFALFTGSSGNKVGEVMFAGACIAGVFGTATLKSPLTALQALVGIIGLFVAARLGN